MFIGYMGEKCALYTPTITCFWLKICCFCPHRIFSMAKSLLHHQTLSDLSMFPSVPLKIWRKHKVSLILLSAWMLIYMLLCARFTNNFKTDIQTRSSHVVNAQSFLELNQCICKTLMTTYQMLDSAPKQRSMTKDFLKSHFTIASLSEELSKLKWSFAYNRQSQRRLPL